VAEALVALERAWQERAMAAGLRLGVPASFVAETASTNDDAKRAAASGAPHGALFVAESQSAGRGRQGRAWQGEPGASLLFSVVVRCAVAPHAAGAIPVAAGLALAEAIDAIAPRPCALVKWPNDVRIGGKKVAGILADATVRAGVIESVVVGVGVNVGAFAFDASFADRATSLAREGIEVDRLKILEAFLVRFEAMVERIALHGLRDYASRIAAKHELFGCEVRRAEGDVARAAGIDEEGRLVVDRGGVVERWSSGEVHLVAAGGLS
jgi:BirA family transcriptional regulator, biotin operon repressor / biotin---[acetyl-CoA-carboxylase] ligase